MASQVAEYLLYAVGAAAAIAWSIVIIQRWAPAARRRGGQWELEALLLICGPISAILVAFYPADGSGPGVLGMASRVVTDVAYALAAVAIIGGLRAGRAATAGRTRGTALLVALLVYYFSLIASGLGGVVPGIPEAYWSTPLLVLAFVINAGCELAWFLRMSRVAIRTIVVLSLFTPYFAPQIAFNSEDIRTLFGMNRLQGITSHPNTLGILAAIGLVLEISHKSKMRFVWVLCMGAGILLAQSTTAYVAAFVAILFLASRISRVLRRLAIPVAGLGSIAVILLPQASQAVSSFFTVGEATKLLNGRTGIWDAVLSGFYQNPLWGYGPSLLDDAYRQIYLPNFNAAAQAHNQWFQTLGEAGLFGAAALIVLLIVMVAQGYRTSKPSKGVSAALLAILFIRAVSETPLRPTGASLITFIMLVVIGALVYAPRQTTGRVQPITTSGLSLSAGTRALAAANPDR